LSFTWYFCPGRFAEGALMADPFGLPNVNEQSYRAVNPVTGGRLRELGDTYLAALDAARQARLELVREVETARVAGHSFPQLCEASGLPIATIQNILRTVSVEKLSLNPSGYSAAAHASH
jgi:hypothetical protein